MSTIKENIAKLNEASQRRGEFSRNLDEYISVHQDNLPQELVTAWFELEKWELEVRTVDVEVAKELRTRRRNVRLVKRFDAVARVLLLGLFLFSIGHVFYVYFSLIDSFRYPMPKDLGECNSLLNC